MPMLNWVGKEQLKSYGNAIGDSDQSRSLRAFWDFLISSSQQMDFLHL